MPKRARDDDGDDGARSVRPKVDKPVPGPVKPTNASQKAKSWVPQERETHKLVKLTPARPFTSVPPGSSATSSRRAQTLNYFLISRRSTLGSYLRRCKAVVLESKHKTIHLSAMGAAIPLLLQITASLPHVLPYDRSKIAIEVKTGTVCVKDERVPNDEEEDVELRTRDKSTLNVVVRIDGGDPETPAEASKKRRKSKKTRKESSPDAMEE
ncbi:hypothetical protein EXIGLDRAFT_640887, partial [Exidia glandulosa HHB12029]